MMGLSSTRTRSSLASIAPSFPSPIGLERVTAASSILDAIRVTPLAVAEMAATVDSATVRRSVVGRLVTAVRDDSDALTGIAAVHALAAIPGSQADHALADVLRSGPGPLPAHAAWASAGRAPAAELLEPLVDVLIAGGLGGMHAQAALAQWARSEPWLIAAALRGGLGRSNEGDGRRPLIETLGLVPDDGVLPDLTSVAADRSETEVVRVAAIAALGDRHRSPMPRSIAVLAGGDDRVADAVRLAGSDRSLRRLDFVGGESSQRMGSAASPEARGVRVAQVHLGAVLDPDLLHSGVGDTGGIATLLVRLGVALARSPGIAEVITIGRGTVGDALGVGEPAGGLRFAPVALEPEAGTAFGDSWPARISAERGLQRVIRVHGRPDVIHLRMADAGTLAAANVAAMRGIPTVFSLAPDPHGLIASRELSGDLDRRSFGFDDAILHFWYRVHLVERLAREADHVALFPRERLIDQLRELVGIDVMAAPGSFTVVPEGIDIAQIRHAGAAIGRFSGGGVPNAADLAAAGASGRRGEPPARALGFLLDRVAALPRSRHGLPLVLSVGRLNELKGMARLVEAFASDPALRARATLVIVGGDLDDPAPAEAIELARIRAVQAAQPDLATALVLLGHRPNGEIPQLLAAVRHGVGRLIGPDGAYACASRKEEFGLAIVEALAAGLPVVAPLAGGPATYVEEGRTGWLVDTDDPTALARGVANALDLADRPGRAEYAAETIAARYDISGMAQAMTSIYRRVAIGSRDSIAS